MNTDGLTGKKARMWLLERLRTQAYKQGTFTLASGKQSDFFIDCKRVVLSGNAHVLVGYALLEELWPDIRSRRLNYVAGVELGGCPLASAVAMAVALESPEGEGVDALYVRKAAKDHGTKALVEGLRPPGVATTDAPPTVVLLEDVVTTGGSSLRAVESLNAAGLTVLRVVALVDRLEGAREAFEAAGVPFSSLFTRKDFVT